MAFSVSAYVDDYLVSVPAETAKEAFAKAVEWHVAGKLADVSISDGIGSYSIAEFSAIMANDGSSPSAAGMFFYPATDLPNDTPLKHVVLSTRIQNALAFGGIKTVGDVRMASDAALLSFPDLGKGSVRHLRKTLGLKAEK